MITANKLGRLLALYAEIIIATLFFGNGFNAR